MISDIYDYDYDLHCGQIVIQKLRSRVAVFLREPATISSATWAVTSVVTAPMTTHVSSVSDMGNSANVNPPAKCSRADRTPIRSSKRSPTGGGIPSGSSCTHSETMCDVDEMSLAASEGDWHPTLTNPSSTPRDPFDIGSGSCAPTGGTPVAEVEGETSTPSATFSREGTLMGRPQGGQHRARNFHSLGSDRSDCLNDLHMTSDGLMFMVGRRGTVVHQMKSFPVVCLFPAVLNLASMAEITANATCGENGSEMYCKLVEHVPGQPVKNPQCRTCNLNSQHDYGKTPAQA
ncbi:Laminin subunit alpha-2 [Triplophysa tibetana]|uniref:Laminin subunit alpha-2 n=1 Tax=Triplophysa tibetana TaxID=1572043 RepID=A0A5A9NH56_9TELE|nr:Laminin subunit alpha-2 [Triplophysa tibetana]